MALILSIETSEKCCSVALSNNYDLLSTLEIHEEKSHASMLTLLIKKLLADKETDISKLDAIAISKGPGSYTGLRIGVSVAKGICYALDIPLISINTLKLLYLRLICEGWLRKLELNDQNLLLCPLIDARRMEVYKVFFNINGDQIGKIEADIIHENSFNKELLTNKIVFFGSGSEKCKSIMHDQNAYFLDNIKPNACFMVSYVYDLFVQKEFENCAYFEPFYLKDFVVTVPKKRVVTF